MVLFENHKDLAKVSRLLVPGFVLEIFKIYWLVWIFLWIFDCFESVSSIFHLDLYKYSLIKYCPRPHALFCCDIMLLLVIDLPDSVGNLWPRPLLPSP
jgi:hypothetical protein